MNYDPTNYNNANGLEQIHWESQGSNPAGNVQKGKVLESLQAKIDTETEGGRFIKRTNKVNFVKVKMRKNLHGSSLLIPKLRQEAPSFSE